MRPGYSPGPFCLCHFFLFFNGFLTPRLTRYTEAARIAPSANCESGVETNAKSIGTSIPPLSGFSATDILHDTQNGQGNNETEKCPLHHTPSFLLKVKYSIFEKYSQYRLICSSDRLANLLLCGGAEQMKKVPQTMS